MSDLEAVLGAEDLFGDSDDSPRCVAEQASPVPTPAAPAATPKQERKPMSDKTLRRVLQGIGCFEFPGGAAHAHYRATGLLTCRCCLSQITVKTVVHAEQHWKKHKELAGAAPASPTPVLLDKKLNLAVAAALTLADVSYRSADTLRLSGFETLVRCGPGIPERHALPGLVTEFARGQLESMIRDACRDAPVVLAVDESSSHWPTLEDRPRVLSIVCINLHTGVECCMYVNNKDSCTADTVKQAIIDQVSEKKVLKASQILAIISDNASYMTKCVADLRKRAGFEHVLHLRCVAHTLSLQVKTLLGTLNALEPTLKSISKLWSRSLPIRTALKKAVGSPITRGNDTRWAYYLEAVEHLLEVAEYPRALGGTVKRLRWEVLQETLQSIEGVGEDKRQIIAKACHFFDMPNNLFHTCVLHVLLANATSVFRAVQVSGAAKLTCSASCVVDLRRLMDKLSNGAGHTALLVQVTHDAARELEWTVRGGDMVDKHSKLKLEKTEIRAIMAKVQEGLAAVAANVEKHYDSNMRRLVALKRALNPQLSEPLPQGKALLNRQLLWTHDFSMARLQRLKDQLKCFAEAEHTLVPGDTLAVYWERLAPAFDELAQFALNIHNVPLSSAGAERVFSVLEHMQSDVVRSRLSEPVFMAELLIKSNRPLAQQHVQSIATQATVGRAPSVQSSMSSYFSPGSKRSRQ